MFKLVTAVAAFAVLAACSHGQPQTAKSRPLAAPPASADPNEAVWHLRAGLNVAALLCKGRGRVAVAPGYARLLDRHRGLLAAAYSAEQRRHGSGFDRHQTRLYNRFANPRDPARFCRSAAGVASRSAAMSSPDLSRRASALLGELN